jgi:uncharacterized protein (TIGR02996 family)
MNFADAILQDVIENHDDDTPRLVYADWLEDHGNPRSVARAEFIRLQCRLARLPQDDSDRPLLRTREQELLARHGREWRSPLSLYVKKQAFHRGFVETVDVPADRFRRHADLLFAKAPVRHLHLQYAAGILGTVAACPHAARLRTLVVKWGYWPYQGREMDVLALANSRHVAGLTTLDLSRMRLQEPEAHSLADSPLLPRLAHLNLRLTGATAAVARALAECPARTALVSLDLSHNPIGDAGAIALANSPYLARIERLSLRAAYIGAEGIEALAASTTLRPDRLDLSGSLINRHGVEALRKRYGECVRL